MAGLTHMGECDKMKVYGRMLSVEGIRSMYRVIGIDIGGTKCAVMLADAGESVHIIKKLRFDTCTSLGFEYTRDRLFECVHMLISQSDAPVRAIGISCGGPLDSRRGIIQSPPNLPGWDDVHIVDMLRDAFGIPAFIQNDANACGLVEWKLGAGRGCENMVFLTMGTGMGAGVIAEGRLLRGAGDMAGEVGRVRLRKKGPIGYNKAGSFEGFASGGGIAQLACVLRSEWTEAGDAPKWPEDDSAITEKCLAEYARAGDRHALDVFNRVGAYLGEGIAVLADILNPEMIVIGGIYMRCADLLADSMWKSIRREALRQTAECLKVCPAETGEAIGDYAAVQVAVWGLDNK